MESLSSEKGTWANLQPPSDTWRNSLRINYASENGLDDHMAMTTGPYLLLQDKSTLTEGY